MDKKIAIPLGAALALGLVLVGAYMLYPGSGSQGPGLPKHAAVMGTYQMSTDSSVTIVLDDGRPQTFAVSSTTKVISQVTSAQTGKALSEFTAGAAVQIQPSNKDKRAADMVLLVPTTLNTSGDSMGPPVTLLGSLVATTTTNISIQTEQDPSLQVILSPDTLVYSNTLAGRRGASLGDVSVGTYVQVVGVATTGGVVARSIQLLVPLAQ